VVSFAEEQQERQAYPLGTSGLPFMTYRTMPILAIKRLLPMVVFPLVIRKRPVPAPTIATARTESDIIVSRLRRRFLKSWSRSFCLSRFSREALYACNLQFSSWISVSAIIFAVSHFRQRTNSGVRRIGQDKDLPCG
jgi:hypothetical protein